MEKCEICESNLYMSLNDGAWCPQCNGVTPLDKKESLKLCDNLIKDINENINGYSNFFSFDSLLYAAYESREANMKKTKQDSYMSWNIQDIIWSTILIKRALNGMHGDENVPDFKKKLAPLFQSILDFVSLNNDKILIEQEYGSFFKKSDIKGKKQHSYLSSEDGQSYVFIPNFDWAKYLANLEEGNFVRESKLEKVAQKSVDRNTAETADERRLRIFEMIYNGFHNSYYNSEMFAFAEIDYKNKEVLDFFSEITDFALEKAKILVRTHVVKISKEEFFRIANNHNYDSNKLFQMFVSSKSNINEFPILIEHNNEIVLSSETMFLIRGILKYLSKGKEVNTLIDGIQFEREVESQLKNLGFETDDPLNHGAYLRGRIIKIIDPVTGNVQEREIDLMAYNESELLVIECKEWRLAPKLIWKFRQDYRVRDIKDEIDEKHLDRLKFVKNNYKARFGFTKDYEVKGILVTRLKENIDEYKSIKILARSELDENLNI